MSQGVSTVIERPSKGAAYTRACEHGVHTREHVAPSLDLSITVVTPRDIEPLAHAENKPTRSCTTLSVRH